MPYTDWKTKVWIVNLSDSTTDVAEGDRVVFFGAGDGTATKKNILGRIPRWGKQCDHRNVNSAGVLDKVYVKDSNGDTFTITRDSGGTTLTCKKGTDPASGTPVWTAVDGG